MSEGAGRKQVRLEAVLIGCRPGDKAAAEEDCFLLGTLDERFLTVREFDLQSFQFGLFWKEVQQPSGWAGPGTRGPGGPGTPDRGKDLQAPRRLGPLAEKVFPGLPVEALKSSKKIQEQTGPFFLSIFFLLKYFPQFIIDVRKRKAGGENLCPEEWPSERIARSVGGAF